MDSPSTKRAASGDASTLPDRNRLMKLINDFNLHRAGRLGEIEVRDEDEQLVFEGVLRIYWGVKKPIVLASGEMGDLSPQRRRRSGNVVASDLSKYSRRWSQSATKRNTVSAVGGEPPRAASSASKAAQRAASRAAAKQGAKRVSQANSDHDSSGDDSVEIVKIDRRRTSAPSSSSSQVDDEKEEGQRSASEELRGSKLGVKRSQSSDDQWQAVMKRNTRRTKRTSYHGGGGQALAEMFTPPHGSVTNLRATSQQNTNQVGCLQYFCDVTGCTLVRVPCFIQCDTSRAVRCVSVYNPDDV